MFSVIVPTYNRNFELQQLINSLQEQTYSEFEIVVVDDCSKQAVLLDETKIKTKVYRNKNNVGAAKSRNIAVEKSSFEWLVFLDDDDRFDIKKLECLKDVIINNPEVNFIYHPARIRMVNEKVEYITNPIEDVSFYNLSDLLFRNKIGGAPLFAIKKSLFLSVKGFSEELKALEDYEFLIKIFKTHHARMFFIKDPMTICEYSTRKASVSKSIVNVKNALDFISKNHILNDTDLTFFKLNRYYILSHATLMNLSRKASYYYLLYFISSRDIAFLFFSIISLINPKLLIKLRKYKNKDRIYK